MLLNAGVDVNHKNMLGMNALLLVSGYGNDILVKMVLQAGADPNSVNDFGHSALHLAVVGKRSQVCQTCLFMATFHTAAAVYWEFKNYEFNGLG